MTRTPVGWDVGSSSCCQCYQLIFENPEPGSPQPPALPIPKPMIVQSFNTAAGGGKNFDIYTGYTTTTMQDCCKPSCAWQNQVGGAGLTVVDKWTSFYSCDQNGVPITAP